MISDLLPLQQDLGAWRMVLQAILQTKDCEIMMALKKDWMVLRHHDIMA